jgi:hypothetical protein
MRVWTQAREAVAELLDQADTRETLKSLGKQALLAMVVFAFGCTVVKITEVPPDSRLTVSVHQVILPWRSIVAEGSTNNVNNVSGGGTTKLTVP